MLPKNLKEIVHVPNQEESSAWSKGKVQCTCGKDAFRLWIYADRRPNEYPCVARYEGKAALCIVAECTCGKEWLIFDYAQHGYEGFVCHSGITPPREKLVQWECPTCHEQLFSIDIQIQNGDFDQFMEEIVEDSDGEFTEEDFPEAFEWIQINLACKDCPETYEGWLNLETC